MSNLLFFINSSLSFFKFTVTALQSPVDETKLAEDNNKPLPSPFDPTLFAQSLVSKPFALSETEIKQKKNEMNRENILFIPNSYYFH